MVSAALAGVISAVAQDHVRGHRWPDPSESCGIGSRTGGFGEPDQSYAINQSGALSTRFGIREFGPVRRIPGFGRLS